MDQSRAFIAQEAPLVFYNAKAILNLAFPVLYDDEDETPFDFPGFVSAYFRIYDGKKRIQLLKNFATQVTRNSYILIMNCSVADMTFDDQGIYFFEMGYNYSGYEVPIRYGDLTIL